MATLGEKIRQANDQVLVQAETEAIPRFFADGYVAHGTGRRLTGHDWIARYVSMLHGAFADLSVEVEILLEGEDRTSWHRTLRGTHKAPFMGFPATQAEIVWRDMLTSRFQDGLIAEEWVVSDLAEHLLRAYRPSRG